MQADHREMAKAADHGEYWLHRNEQGKNRAERRRKVRAGATNLNSPKVMKAFCKWVTAQRKNDVFINVDEM